MEKIKLTHESRCLVILIGGVLEGCIEKRSRSIADSRSADKILPEDIDKALSEFLKEELSNLPHLIEQAIVNYRRQTTKAA